MGLDGRHRHRSIDGHIWAYERCGAGVLSGGPVNCETNPVDPIFKFDRNTEAVVTAIRDPVAMALSS